MSFLGGGLQVGGALAGGASQGMQDAQDMQYRRAQMANVGAETGLRQEELSEKKALFPRQQAAADAALRPLGPMADLVAGSYAEPNSPEYEHYQSILSGMSPAQLSGMQGFISPNFALRRDALHNQSRAIDVRFMAEATRRLHEIRMSILDPARMHEQLDMTRDKLIMGVRNIEAQYKGFFQPGQADGLIQQINDQHDAELSLPQDVHDQMDKAIEAAFGKNSAFINPAPAAQGAKAGSVGTPAPAKNPKAAKGKPAPSAGQISSAAVQSAITPDSILDGALPPKKP